MTNLLGLISQYKCEIATIVVAIASMAAPLLPKLLPATAGCEGEIGRDLMVVAMILAYMWGVKVATPPPLATALTVTPTVATPAPLVPVPGLPGGMMPAPVMAK